MKMESFLFWLLNGFETGLIIGLIIHIKKNNEMFERYRTEQSLQFESLERALVSQIPNRACINGETVRLYQKEETS